MKKSVSLQQVDHTSVLWKGRKLAYFAGCDYFRLSTHPAIRRAVTEGLKKYGLNVAASRVTTGDHALYGQLETALARYFGAPAAVLASNGYATNSIVAQTLRGDFTHVLIDAKAHVSLRDAGRLFGCPVIDFKTRDPADLRRVLAKAGKNARPILLTDGVFTYEGEIAPLPEYVKILGPRGMILLDDAHGAGVIGRTGRGAVQATGAARERIIQTTTLSKAFGVYGGAILGSRALCKKIVAHSAMFAGGTPLPLPLANAALRSIELLTANGDFLRRLNRNVERFKTALREAGIPVAMTSVPVAAITPATAAQAASLRRSLLAHGIFPSFIQYPGGPSGGYLRIVLSSGHSQKQLKNLLTALGKSGMGFSCRAGRETT